MKIVFVIGQLGLGGGERQLYLLLKHINRKIFEPVIISLNPGRNDYWEEPIQKLGIPIHFVPRSKSTLKRFFVLFKILLTERPDVLISWTLHLNFFVALMGNMIGVKFNIGSIRNDLFNPARKDRPIHRFFGTKGADVFVANSSKGKVDMVSKLGIRETRVKIIFNAILPGDVDRSVESRVEIRNRLNLPQDGFLLVNVGRIEKAKNQSMLVHVLNELKDEKNIHVVYIGIGPDVTNIQELAVTFGVHDRIHFTGSLPVAIQYLHAFDVMCHTGLADGMPNVLLEGAVSNLPLVSSRVNGAEDIIRHGETGYIVEYNDHSKMADIIRNIYENKVDVSRMVKLSNDLVAKEFSVTTMVNSFERLFLSKG